MFVIKRGEIEHVLSIETPVKRKLTPSADISSFPAAAEFDEPALNISRPPASRNALRLLISVAVNPYVADEVFISGGSTIIIILYGVRSAVNVDANIGDTVVGNPAALYLVINFECPLEVKFSHERFTRKPQ